jgi:hypothetical protein
MIADRAPGTVWCLSRNNLSTYVTTEINDHISLVGPDSVGSLTGLVLTRHDARMLAKRINECLDETVKR